MKRKNLSDTECPVARSLDVIGDGWSLLIIRDAFDGISRFSAFQKNLGIARSMLTARLLALVEQGVLETIPASDGTAYQEYVLTEMGRGLFPVIIALRQWGEDHLYQPDEQHSVLIDTQTGEPVTRLELRSKENQVLEWRDTTVRKVSPDLK
ncbi:winged helix-turn-helix transcriptional regulator [Shewanella baltica]|uniref:Transcriptional regulator, HxlR family n=1 Tax=Shewanella baltica (strain OS155 / ATCC BAA-1091) TaxID=325240 RepID=A3D3A1_SHEB5|nr:helix-turn-helix domain-containing protein [Shewanella baltica]ABN61214.1 transcriptional regulator, HxlR family [Shewanella baltica OS155]AEH13565.1 transcriptional regulator, HxlR family [Shewanella baltica OS117]